MLEVVGYRHVVLDREAGTVRFDRPGVELDLGGIGKGYAVDRVVDLLRRRGVASALVNLGGSSVYGLGAPPGKDAWEIGIQDPTDPAKIALTVRLRDRALSVSGGYERFFEKDGVTYSHIMDPRTGRPVQGVLSVAVLSDRATDGDALDDVLFVQGVERACPSSSATPPRRRSSSCRSPAGDGSSSASGAEADTMRRGRPAAAERSTHAPPPDPDRPPPRPRRRRRTAVPAVGRPHPEGPRRVGEPARGRHRPRPRSSPTSSSSRRPTSTR